MSPMHTYMYIDILLHDCVFQVNKHLVTMAERAALVDYETKENRTDPSSNYSWSKLSPGSQERRRKKLVKERRDLLRKVAKIRMQQVLTL